MTREEELHYALLKSEETVKKLQQRIAWHQDQAKEHHKATYDVTCKLSRLDRKHGRLAEIVRNVCSKGRKAQAMMAVLNLLSERDSWHDKYYESQRQLREALGRVRTLESDLAKAWAKAK